GERSLDGGLVHFPVALRRVSVADLEQGTRGVDGNEQCGPSDQLLVVHVARVNAGWVRADATRIAWRRHAHAAEEGMQGDHHSRGELRDHTAAIERNDPRELRAVTVHREKSAAAVVAVRQGEIDAENSHLEHVTRIGGLDVDGPGENVST